MVLGNPISFDCQIDGDPQTPARVECPWTTVCTAPDNQDADPIVNPTTEIVNATTSIFMPNVDAGTLIAMRLGYDDGMSSITNPTVNLFGRTGTAGLWQRLESIGGIEVCTLTTDATNDVSDGTLQYTAVDSVDNIWHVQGCNQFLVGIKTALAGTGTKTNSIIQVRFID